MYSVSISTFLLHFSHLDKLCGLCVVWFIKEIRYLIQESY